MVQSWESNLFPLSQQNFCQWLKWKQTGLQYGGILSLEKQTEKDQFYRFALGITLFRLGCLQANIYCSYRNFIFMYSLNLKYIINNIGKVIFIRSCIWVCKALCDDRYTIVPDSCHSVMWSCWTASPRDWAPIFILNYSFCSSLSESLPCFFKKFSVSLGKNSLYHITFLIKYMFYFSFVKGMRENPYLHFSVYCFG